MVVARGKGSKDTPMKTFRNSAGSQSSRPGFVRIRGLPFDATAQDVAELFQNFNVPMRNVYMGLSNRGPTSGRPDGQCIIKISNGRQVDQVVKELNHSTMGSRYLELFPADEEDFSKAWEEGRLMSGPGGDAPGRARQERPRGTRENREPPRFAARERSPRGKGNRGKGKGKGKPRMEFEPFPEPSEEDGVLRIRGLPFQCTPEEVVSAFAQYNIETTDVFLGCMATGPRAGQPDGQAFIQFPSAEVGKDVKRECQDMEIGGRYLEIYQSSEEDLEYQIGRGCVHESYNPFETPGAGYIRLSGLPFAATQSEILEFVGNSYGISEEDIVLRYDPVKKRPCGEAYIQLDSEETALAAQQDLNRKVLDERFIEVLMSSANEVNRFARPSPYQPIRYHKK